MNVGSIAGGTNAGWRKVKQAHPKWYCKCIDPVENTFLPGYVVIRRNPGWRGECSDCGAERPT